MANRGYRFDPSQMIAAAQPFRVPAGWIVGPNKFQAGEVPAEGYGGSSVLYLMRADRRLCIDVEWHPESDPNGHYHYYVEQYAGPEGDAPDPGRLDSGESRSSGEVVAWVNHWLARGLAEAPTEGLPPDIGSGPAPEQLHPLRICSGWNIHRNALTTVPAIPAGSDPGGVRLFRAVDAARRLRLDVTTRAESGGQVRYALELVYSPWSRTERGRRRTEVPLSFEGDVRRAHSVDTPVYADLVRELERCLWGVGAEIGEGH